MEKDYILDIMRSNKTVFTFQDVVLLWGESDVNFIKKKIHRYVKAGKLNAIRKGIYSKDKNYDKYELSTKIYTPAYVSFETVLGASGITFQFYSQIFVASYTTKEIECDGQKFAYKKIKDAILSNQLGVEKKENYSIASPERAFLDVVYLNKDYHFDNLSVLNWEKVYEILPIYGGNKRMAKMVKMYHEASKNNLK
ncbi:MAG: type IV toxin-antitoxin system AbiEi family antitoxin domain-containing protein [Patescibacteria group bacterium]